MPSARAWGALVERIGRFLAAIAALCALAAFPSSALFDLQEVSIVGNRIVPASEILRRAEVGPGESAFRVDAARIRATVLQDSRIQDVSVALAFPRQVTISVQESPPVAALPVATAYALLGADGVVMAQASRADPYPLLVVDNVKHPWARVGMMVLSSRIRLGARIAGRLPDRLRGRVRLVRVTSKGEVVLGMQDGVAVRLGGERDIAERLFSVPAVLAALDARGLRVEYVDVRFPGSIIVRPLRGTKLRSEGMAPGGASPPTPVPTSPRVRQENPEVR